MICHTHGPTSEVRMRPVPVKVSRRRVCRESENGERAEGEKRAGGRPGSEAFRAGSGRARVMREPG